MKAKQLAMDEALADLDRYARERLCGEQTETIRRLDEQFERMVYEKINKHEYRAGSVVIIAQRLFRNGYYNWHFLRTVLNYDKNGKSVFVEDTNDEYPERPPWADTVGHEGERRDIHWSQDMIHWFTGEVVEPIETLWMKEYKEWMEANA